jgi:hypothetical protein
MQKDCMTIEWNDKFYYQKCYEFLFEEIKAYYLVHIFPNAFASGHQNKPNEPVHNSDEKRHIYLQCKEEIVKWLINILVIDTDASMDDSSSASGYFALNSTSSMLSGVETLKPSTVMTQSTSSTAQTRDPQDDYYYNDYDVFTTNTNSAGSVASGHLTSDMGRHLVQKILLSCSINVNLIHEIIRQSFIVNFEDPLTVRKVLDAYRKWFLREALLPVFMQEPAISLNMAQKTQELINKYNQQQPIPLGNCFGKIVVLSRTYFVRDIPSLFTIQKCPPY